MSRNFAFQPDYELFVQAALNQKTRRLVLYEHIISPVVMERVLDCSFASLHNSAYPADLREFFNHYCRFFKEMTYDTVSYEYCITPLLPAAGQALMGKMAGPIQSWSDFERFDWQGVVERYISVAQPRFESLAYCLPAGMKAVGGVGNGVFEILEDLVGLEPLSYLMADEPVLVAKIAEKVGELMYQIWRWFLSCFSDAYCVCRFGDDLGYKGGLLTTPRFIRSHILPQYRRIIDLVHQYEKPFLWHSCGCIFEVMEDVIELGINAKHSNEDNIAPFEEWIKRYGDRIALFGGIDLNDLCVLNPTEISQKVYERGLCFRNLAKGFALGSGNSIPDYVPADHYLAMIEGAQKIRQIR